MFPDEAGIYSKRELSRLYSPVAAVQARLRGRKLRVVPLFPAAPEYNHGVVKDSRILEAPVLPTLIRLATPMAAGIVAIMFFNVVDTFWVGRLGPDALAAMGFIFPVTFVLKAVTIGLGVGITATISRVVGSGNEERVRSLTTDSLLLGLLVITLISVSGLLGMDPLFRILGAEGEVLRLIRSYMVPWFAGIGLLVVPMMGNSAIRATGDTRSPARIMILAGCINAVFDPFLIFGAGPFPALGLQGAALASVSSWVVALFMSIRILGSKLGLLRPGIPRLKQMLESFRPVLAIGIPAAGTNLLAPMTIGYLTRLVAAHGPKAVAGFGVATRIQSLAMIGLMAMGAAMTPFIGQNFGAGSWERIRRAVVVGGRFSLVWGAFSLLILGGAAPLLMGIFSRDPVVISRGTLFLRIVPFSHWAVGIGFLAGSIFNALGKPLEAAGLVIFRLLGVAVPLAWLGARLLGVPGIFGALALANIAGAAVAWFRLWRHLDRAPLASDLPEEEAAEESGA